MRIVHVDTERGWRGGQTQLLHLGRAQRDCAVICPPDAPLRDALDDAQVPVVPVTMRGRWWGTRGLDQAIRRLAPDLVAAHTSHAVAHLGRLQHPWVAHRRVDFAPSRSAVRRLNRARGVVAVSRAVQGVLRGVGVVAPICVVHDGIEPLPTPREGARARVRQRLGLREDESLVVAVGALVDHKGHRIVVRALSQLPRTHLAICGRGPLRRSLLRLAGHEGVGDRLHLPGHVGDVSDWLAAADVFCHPSLEEGLGQAVIEALVHGVPVVASRAGGLPETVQGHGTLVPPGDPGALAAALRQTLVGGAGCPDAHRAKLLERFGTEAMVRGTEQAYRTFLEGAR